METIYEVWINNGEGALTLRITTPNKALAERFMVKALDEYYPDQWEINIEGFQYAFKGGLLGDLVAGLISQRKAEHS